MNMKTLFSLCAALLFGAQASQAQTVEAGRSVVITIHGVPAEERAVIDGTYQVSDGGVIRMPFVGSIRAAGLSSSALAANIEGAYKAAQIYTNPSIQVVSTSLGAQPVQLVVHIGGKVLRPGPTPFTPGLTIYQAVAAAGGPDPFGAMNRVVLTRDGKQRTFNLKKAEEMSFVLEANDTIMMPEKNWLGQ